MEPKNVLESVSIDWFSIVGTTVPLNQELSRLSTHSKYMKGFSSTTVSGPLINQLSNVCSESLSQFKVHSKKLPTWMMVILILFQSFFLSQCANSWKVTAK